MKVIRKNKQKQLLIAILAFALALLTAGAILIDSLLNKEPDEPQTQPPEIIEGLEAIYNNSAIVYPRIKEKDISLIRVVGKDNSYALIRQTVEKDNGSISYGDFVLSYQNSEGEWKEYNPAILQNDPSSSYSDIYALESSDSFGVIPKLSYLCSAIGTPYFKERIELPKEDGDERSEMLRRYGITKDKAVTIGFEYIDDDGNEQSHVLTIGDSMITGMGHYFLVDDRDYVYSVESNNYFDYALADFTTFVKPVLTAAGLEMDGAFEPYLTTGFEQWKNVLYDDNKLDDGDGADIVKQNSNVTVNSATITPSGSDGHVNGYLKSAFKSRTFDLSKIDSDELYKYSIAALVGKPLGALNDSIIISSFNYLGANVIDAGDISDGVTYEYTITAIESVITENGEGTEQGLAVGSAKYVKVTYTAKINGEAVGSVPLHAVINLDEGFVQADAVSQIRAASVGELSAPIVFEVDYSRDNSVKRNIVITEIITIRDKNDEILTKAIDGATVMYRFRYEVNGVLLDNYGTATIEISDDLEGQAKEISDALKGKKQSKELDIVISDGNYELMHAFVAYEISEVKYFVVGENIVSFKFQQASERDPYYGESLYENTMTGNYKMYALNATACESVVKMLGGIGKDSSSSTGLSAIKTVALGLTPENMYEYGLYAYTVYFELPRGITSINIDKEQDGEDDADKIDDYTYYSTLGFNLYISEVVRIKGERYRYVGSDMYDLVALVSADTFEFLEYGFSDFYARRNIMLTNISNIANIKFEFLMDDIKGSFENVFTHQNLYTYKGKVYSKSELNEEQLKFAEKYDAITINVKPDGDCTETEFSRFLEKNNLKYASLYEFFDSKVDKFDQLGTAVFKELTELIFYTCYEGNIDEDETQYSWQNGTHLMTMRVTLCEEEKGKYEVNSPFDYVYEFYRVSDRRVVVRLYQQNRVTQAIQNEVCDFYISTLSFKKIVSAYLGILNKEQIDNNTAYS